MGAAYTSEVLQVYFCYSLNMGMVEYSETALRIYQAERRQIQQDKNPHSYRVRIWNVM